MKPHNFNLNCTPELLAALKLTQDIGDANLRLMSREQAVNLLREIRDAQRAAIAKAQEACL